MIHFWGAGFSISLCPTWDMREIICGQNLMFFKGAGPGENGEWISCHTVGSKRPADMIVCYIQLVTVF